MEKNCKALHDNHISYSCALANGRLQALQRRLSDENKIYKKINWRRQQPTLSFEFAIRINAMNGQRVFYFFSSLFSFGSFLVSKLKARARNSCKEDCSMFVVHCPLHAIRNHLIFTWHAAYWLRLKWKRMNYYSSVRDASKWMMIFMFGRVSTDQCFTDVCQHVNWFFVFLCIFNYINALWSYRSPHNVVHTIVSPKTYNAETHDTLYETLDMDMRRCGVTYKFGRNAHHREWIIEQSVAYDDFLQLIYFSAINNKINEYSIEK